MKLIDLSHVIKKNMSTYPSDPKIHIKKEKTIENNNSLVHSFKMGTHTGTHLDVPAHISLKGKTLHEIPIVKFAGIAVKVDANSCNELQSGFDQIDGVIFDSGWYVNFDNPNIFFGGSRPKIPNRLIELCLAMNIKFFGCDLPSVDESGSENKENHHSFLDNEIIIYEALNNLDKLKILEPFQFYGFPLAFKNLDGSPVRAVAHKI